MKMKPTPVYECIAAAHRANLQNAEQLSAESIPARFIQLCAWYSQAEREASGLRRERDKLLEQRDGLLRALENIKGYPVARPYPDGPCIEREHMAEIRAAIDKVINEGRSAEGGGANE